MLVGSREGGGGEGGEGDVLVEFMPFSIVVVDDVGESDHSGDEGDGEKGIQSAVEDVPEANVVPSHLPEFGCFVADEAEGHDV